MSERTVEVGTLEQRTDDVRAVMDAARSERAALLGSSEGAAMAILFAATYPDRVSALILYGALARDVEAPDYPYRAAGYRTKNWRNGSITGGKNGAVRAMPPVLSRQRKLSPLFVLSERSGPDGASADDLLSFSGTAMGFIGSRSRLDAIGPAPNAKHNPKRWGRDRH